MSTSKELTIQEPAKMAQVRPLLPSSIEEAWRLAKYFSMAQMLPKSYGSGDENLMAAKAFTAMQLGAEVGFSPMQSIQSIAVVNGMPTIWGDAQLALVLNHSSCEEVEETFIGTPYNDDYRAVCKAVRKGRKAVVEEFSVADAKKAGLWGKSGTWTSHPKRMLKYKARAFALRDTFPDVLKGLTHTYEEMIDVTPEPIQTPKFTPPQTPPKRPEATAIYEVLNQEAKTVTQQPPAKQKETNTQPEASNAAKERADKIVNEILAAESLEQLEKVVAENENHTVMMPENLMGKIFESIQIQRDFFKS